MQSHFGSASDGKKTGDGTGVGFFIPLPSYLADRFPDLGDQDRSAPHCTFLYVGKVDKDREEQFLEAISGVFSTFRGPVRGSLYGPEYFVHPAKERRVAVMRVRFNRDLAALRWKLRDAIQEAGFNVDDSFPLIYQPHVTLQYMDDLDTEYTGPIPSGDWSFDSIEVWGLSKLATVPFGQGVFKTASAPLMTLNGIPLKYRIKVDGNRAIAVMVYSGTKRLGGISAFEVRYPEQKDCGRDVRSLLDRYPQVEDLTHPRWIRDDGVKTTNTRALAVNKAFLDDDVQGKGIGKAMYQAVMAEWFDKVGPFLFMPSACTIGSGTSKMAQGVWKSLAQMYPSSGNVLAVLRKPTLGFTVTKTAGDAHAKSIALMKFLSSVARRLGVAEHVFVVGGAVRNFIINEPIKDVDVVIDSVSLGLGRGSEWFAKEVAKAIPVSTSLVTNNYGVAILTVRDEWILDGQDLSGEVIEIANARKESYGAGGYKPTDVVPATIHEDIVRREFSFNTLMWRLYDLANGPDKAEVLDLSGCGLKDLQEGTMRCPSSPDKTFMDDPSRMIRAIKFLLKYGFKIDPQVEASIRRNAQKLKNIPPGHLSNMIINLFYETGVGKRAFLEMDKLGLLTVIREIIEENKPFREALGNWAEKHADIEFVFDLMDLYLPVGHALNFLTPAQKTQLRENIVGFGGKDVAQHYVEYLQQPGKLVSMSKLIQELGLKGLGIKQLTDNLRQLLLDDPAYMNVPGALEKEILDKMSPIHRVASRYLANMRF